MKAEIFHTPILQHGKNKILPGSHTRMGTVNGMVSRNGKQYLNKRLMLQLKSASGIYLNDI